MVFLRRQGRRWQHLKDNALTFFGGSEPRAEADLGILYRRYRSAVVAYVLRTFGNGPPDPEDVVQATFERYAVFASTKDIENPRAFLFRTAHNYVLDQRRRHSVRSQYAKDELHLSSVSDLLDAERFLAAKEELELLKAAIARLDTRSREMLLLSRIEGLSSAEIARRKGCSATLVKTIIARALVSCHRALDGQVDR